MKNNFLEFLLVAVVAMPAVGETNWGAGAGSTADLTGAPAVRSNPANVNYQKYETRSTTRTYSTNTGSGNTYYRTTGQPTYTAQPSTRSQMYRTYNSGATTRTATNTRTETVRSTMKRKYYLSHPFFQPTEGKFGAITDLSYNTASYDFALTDYTMAEGFELDATAGKWKMKQFAIKEDLSYGITDRFGVVLMGRYDFSKYKFD